jgi:hypothetical protein
MLVVEVLPGKGQVKEQPLLSFYFLAKEKDNIIPT